jgi:hypothetical protein
MISKRNVCGIAVSVVSLFSVVACTTTGTVQGCGGVPGVDYLPCDAQYENFSYTETVGFVSGCVGATVGSGGCTTNGNANCYFTKDYTGKCDGQNIAPANCTNSVPVFKPDGTPCE